MIGAHSGREGREHGWGGDRSGEGFGASVVALGGETPPLAPSARLGSPAGLRIYPAAAAGIRPFASVGSSPSRRPVSCVSFPFRFLRLSGGFMLCSGRSRRRCTYFGSLFLHMGLLLNNALGSSIITPTFFRRDPMDLSRHSPETE